MSLHQLTALALSPVHVGDGTSWTPEAFKLSRDGRTLIRFEPAAVLARMNDADRRKFLAAVGKPRATDRDLQEAQRILREAAREDDAHARVAISSASEQEVRAALDDPGRSGRIHPFVRSGGRPFLPGSAIKGAIRTAVLSTLAQSELGRLVPWLGNKRIQRGKSGPASTELQRMLLGETDTDPFRFVRVADVELPSSATRIEQLFNRKRRGELNGMQMHFECLRPGTRFTISLDIREQDADRARNRDPRKAPRNGLAATELLADVDAFYRRRWSAEMERFFPEPWTKIPPKGSDAPKLMRIGRFSHFESCSVDGLRSGWQPQNGGRSLEEGGTRAVCRVGATIVPFGWVLLVPKEREALLDGLGDRPEPTRSANVIASSLVGRSGEVEGERVRVIEDAGGRLLVEFLDSRDTDYVARTDFEPDT